MRPATSIPVAVALACPAALATPNAQAAQQCLRAAYLLYPYQRPSAARMRSDRVKFFRNCMAQHDAETDSQVATITRAPKGDPAQ